ncbi:PIR Superfamily Protein [Plasmodium ovale wallikeri]|uniref:PIR Superfamily Protein n=1 Tax=Plasmodium ovale wallikeri TaxID=864142 RepID=A0A1A9AI64_PLAOA|nr:PIR Superfamily Protein [Plasmodium ovale wallikeri]
MTNGEQDITSQCQFVDNSRAKQIYNKFDKICDDTSDSLKDFTEILNESEYCSSVTYNLENIKSKLKEILKENEKDTNVISFYGSIENVKKQCMCLKQWFYNEIIEEVKEQKNGYKLLKKCSINDKINRVTANVCKFRNLNFMEILKMKSIFDFYLFYYRNINDLTIEKKLNQYPKYFKKGFYEHCNSILKCLNNTIQSEYCDEFKEYHNYYNAFKVFLEGLIFYGKEGDGSDCDNGCVLGESLLKGKYLLELKEEIKRTKSKHSSTNYSTIAITVIFLVIGIVIGVFLISYYFFGITPPELWLRIRKLINKEAHANLDDETESNSLVTSEYLENNSKRKGYSISYKSAIYS